LRNCFGKWYPDHLETQLTEYKNPVTTSTTKCYKAYMASFKSFNWWLSLLL